MKKYEKIYFYLQCIAVCSYHSQHLPFFFKLPKLPAEIGNSSTPLALRLLQDFPFSIFSIYKIEFPAPVGSAV
jgi:hypothetical protein